MTFEDPVELMCFYDPKFRDQVFRIYPWQKKILQSFARPINRDEIVRIALIAANGSGKSQFALAPAAVWHAMYFPNSQTVVTSASGQQLDKQSARFIKQLAAKVNFLHKELGSPPPWTINYRQLQYRPVADRPDVSYVDLFATDEAGQAEGWHPIVPGGSFAILADEGKTITEDIYESLARCNGCTRRMDISSPGVCDGHFFAICTRPELNWQVEKVTAFECPHIKKAEIDQIILKHGIHDPLVRSSIFAEFSAAGESIVILPEVYNSCAESFDKDKRFKLFGPRRAGLDLAAGGDETVLSIWEGNLQLGQECFRYSDTNQTVIHTIDLLKKWKLSPDNVLADDGGVGRGILDSMRAKGYSVVRVINSMKPYDKTRYANRGTEMWFHFKRFVEDGNVGFLPDVPLKQQLIARYYRQQTSTAKLMLEPKHEAAKKGRLSPDRADACVLAWANVSYPLEENWLEQKDNSHVSIEEIANILRQQKPNYKTPEYEKPEWANMDTVRQRMFIRRPHPAWKLLNK